MRTLSALVLFALLVPAAAMAQTAPAASDANAPAARSPHATRGVDITRDEYVQRAVDRARRAAETRFDRMDTNHDGILTMDERRAARRGGASQSQ
jgi:hypothetical protein